MKSIFFLITLFSTLAGFSQNEKPWKGKKCAVVLTYDDAINQHLDNAIPVLDSLGLKATFYLTAFSQSMQTSDRNSFPGVLASVRTSLPRLP